ncbi:MAG: ABC transporter substrate-binding protein [Promethearchaeia archaeon]
MVNKKILIASIASCILIGTVAGIAIYNTFMNSYPRTITDSLGREVDIPAVEDIEKLVAVQPGALRLVVYLEAEDKVCGVEEIERQESARPYTYAVPELSELPCIGPQFGGDPELIVEQDPDVIFATYQTVEQTDELQELTNIPVIGLEYGDLDDNKGVFYDTLSIMAEVLGEEERADELTQYIDDLIEDLDNRTKDIDDANKDWVYVGGIGYRGAHGLDSTEVRYSPLRFINGKNTAENVSTPDGHAFIDYEQLIQWENETEVLDYILVDGGGYDMCMQDLQNDTIGGELDCVTANPPRVIMTLPYNWYTTNFATVFADAYFLGETFFPNHFSDLNYTNGQIYDNIYKRFVGAEVYEDMSDFYYGGFHNISQTNLTEY